MIKSPGTKIMYLSPVGTSEYDQIFAGMASEYKLVETEVHITSLNPAHGAFSHIEFRSYEAIVTRGIVRAVRAAAKEASMHWRSDVFMTLRFMMPAKCRVT